MAKMVKKITTYFWPMLAPVLTVVLSLLVSSHLPPKIFTHWNEKGYPDCMMDKWWGLLILPILSFVIAIFFAAFRSLDIYHKQSEATKKYFNRFILVLVMFFVYIHIVTLVWNLYPFSFQISLALLPAICLMIYTLGVLLEKVERNNFIGWRLPWTLADDVVWSKTNRLGGKLFKATAIVSLTGMFVPGLSFTIFISLILASVISVSVYSYILARKISN